MIRIANDHQTGGMQQHAEILCEFLAKQGYEVHVITGRHPSYIRNVSRNGFHIHFLKKAIPERYSLDWCFECVKEFLRLHRKISFDLICSESFAAFPLMTIPSLRFPRVPLVTIIHGTAFTDIKMFLRQGFGLKTIFNIIYYLVLWVPFYFTLIRSNLVICTSIQMKNQVLKEYPLLTRDKIIFKPNGVDGKRFKPMRTRDGIKKKKSQIIILSVGRITKQKGFHLVIKALPRLLQQYNNIKFVLIGSGTYLQELIDLSEKLGVKDHVEFLGHVDHGSRVMLNYYNIADVFICPSIGTEGLPYVILEAMAFGLPIIASNVGGIRTALSNLKNSIIIPQNNVDSLIDAIIKLLSNRDLATRLGSKAHSDFIKKFDINKINNSILKLFQKVVSNAHRHNI